MIFLACAAVMMAHPVSWAAQAPTKPQAARNNAEMLPLSFTNTDIYTFADQMANRLGLRPLLVDSAVQGTVDFTGSIPQDDLWNLFSAILENKGAALVLQDNIYRIVPISSAIRYNLETIKEQPAPAPDAGEPSAKIPQSKPAAKSGAERALDSRTIPVATHVIQLDYVPVEETLDTVRLFLSEGAPVITFKRMNMMIITDYSDNAQRVKELVRMLDRAFLDPDLVELIPIKNGNALDVADELKKIFASSMTENANTGVLFLPIERLNGIFVMAGTMTGLKMAKSWIEQLDTYTGGKFQTFVYVVKESTASNIAMQLSALYGDDGSAPRTLGASDTGNTRGTSSSRTSTSSLRNQTLGSSGSDGAFSSAAQLGPRLNTGSAAITSITLPGGGSFSNLRDEARVVVDETNNVLRIQSTPADYRFLLSAIEEMDMPPRQVLFDLEVFQIDLTNDLEYGFSAVLEKMGEEAGMTTGGLPSNSSRPSFSTFTNLGRRQILVALEAMKSKTNLKTIQNPKLLAMDGTPASFQSGADVPFPTDSVYSNNVVSTGMDYRKTGVNLTITPWISASGMVLMDIVQEISNVSERMVADIPAPIFLVTQVQTSLSIKDGDTVAIAGLISDTDTAFRGGIPILSEIPLLGSLFGATSKNNHRTEMIILITPHVVRTQDKFQEITQGLRDSLPHVRRFADEYDSVRIRDIEEARVDREKKELSNIKEIKKPKK